MPVSASLLRKVVERTLLESAFMMTSAGAPGGDPPALRVRIDYAGPEPGELDVACDAAFARALAANLLGLEPDDADVDEAAPAALGELSNILAGLLVHLAWPDAGCRLGLPRPVPVPADPVPDPLLHFLVDDAFHLQVGVHAERTSGAA